MLKVIFGKGESEKHVSGLWQYDCGRTLLISGLDVPGRVKVEFALNENTSDTIPRTGKTENGITTVEIPNILLENKGFRGDYFIYVYIYVQEGDKGYTHKKITLHVRFRARPGDYELPDDPPDYIPAQVIINEENIEKLKSGKISVPTDQKGNADYGSEGQVLKSNGNGTAKWEDAGLGMTEEQAKQLDENTEALKKLTESVNEQKKEIKDKLSTKDLQSAINTALEQAEENGEFDGAPGYTPVKGKDYWTDEDKKEIEEDVLDMMPGYDWNAAENEPGHILNRTHYDTFGIGEVVTNARFTVGEDGSFQVPFNSGIFEGKEYTVGWMSGGESEGTDYTCTCIKYEEEGAVGYILGNFGALMGEEGTGEPFVILYTQDVSDMGSVIALDGSRYVYMNINGYTNVTKELPKRFIKSSLEESAEATYLKATKRLINDLIVSNIDIQEGYNEESLELGDNLDYVGKVCTFDLTIFGSHHRICVIFSQFTGSIIMPYAVVRIPRLKAFDENYKAQYELTIILRNNNTVWYYLDCLSV